MKKKIISLCCFGLVFVLLLGAIARFLQVNSLTDSIRVRGFYLEPRNTLDMVTIGASETYTSIAPGVLWDDYGFTSYNYSTAGCPISLAKCQIKEVLKHQNPKVILFEVNGAVMGKGEHQIQEGRLRKYIDYIPWSENRIEAIKETVPQEERDSYFVPFLKYHSNWKDLKNCAVNLYVQTKMRLQGGSRLKGFQTFSGTGSKTGKLIDVKNDHSTRPLTKEAEFYFRDLLKFLKEEKIDNVLFVRIPHRITKKNYQEFQRSNRVGEILEEYGFPYVNFEFQQEAIGLDPAKDFYNDSHMNVYGQEKFTRYLGGYMVDHYDLKDLDHSTELMKAWDRAAEDTKGCIQFSKDLIERKDEKYINECWREAKKYNIKY